MAQVVQRTWRSGPRKVKRSAWGYTLQVGEKQERKYDAGWSREDAEKALAARLLGLQRAAPPVASPSVMTFGQATEKYLGVKHAEGKRSIRDDRQHLRRLVEAFGASTALREITASRIADYKVQRAQATVKRNGKDQPIAPASVNRELASLRHLLRLAVEEWEVLDKAPAIRLLGEPQGRLDS
jgi:hypothetical protein